MRYLLTIAMKQVAREVNSLLPICKTSRCNLSESLTDLNNGHTIISSLLNVFL